ncbi:MAG: ribbon-helix-helix protein, CopG family [Acidimicrobiales bacterium]
MEVHESAHNHGVADQDSLHAVDHALAVEDAGEDPDRWLVLGPDRAGNLLEVVMTKPRVYGHTDSGRPITDAEVEALAAEAEAGYDVEELIARRGKRGRPSLGSAPATVESVRLDPELREKLAERAQTTGTTTSEVIREALRRFLQAS